MPCPARIGAAFKCSRHAHGVGSDMPEWLDALGQCMRWNGPRLPLLQWASLVRQGMMALTVFFSALGWAGDLGAFLRACSSLAPSSCSCSAEAGAHLGEPVLFFLLDVMGDVLDQHRGLSIEVLSPGRHAR